jgi:hypothetical protein
MILRLGIRLAGYSIRPRRRQQACGYRAAKKAVVMVSSCGGVCVRAPRAVLRPLGFEAVTELSPLPPQAASTDAANPDQQAQMVAARVASTSVHCPRAAGAAKVFKPVTCVD